MQGQPHPSLVDTAGVEGKAGTNKKHVIHGVSLIIGEVEAGELTESRASRSVVGPSSIIFGAEISKMLLNAKMSDLSHPSFMFLIPRHTLKHGCGRATLLPAVGSIPTRAGPSEIVTAAIQRVAIPVITD